MSTQVRPTGADPARPHPIRTDGSNAFARFSMAERVPGILERVLCDETELPEPSRARVARLIDAIRADEPLGEVPLPTPDEAEWAETLSDHPRATWLDSPWFLAECNVYRQLIGACRYWETGRDPFAVAKQQELASDALWSAVRGLEAYDGASPRERLQATLAFALWGNRVDLSYAVGTAFGASGAAEDWLVDDRAWLCDSLRPSDVHIVTDNSGSELAMDLALADAWASDFGARVTLHVMPVIGPGEVRLVTSWDQDMAAVAALAKALA